MKRHTQVVVSTTLLAITAFISYSSEANVGGDKTGSGGIAIVCKNKTGRISSAKLLDIAEATELDGLRFDPRMSGQVKSALEQISIYDSEKTVEKEYKTILKKTHFFKSSEYTLGLPDDFSTRLKMNSNCEFHAVAVYDDILDRLNIEKAAYDFLSPLDKEALILHEAVYKLARKNGVTASQNVRRLIGQAFAKNRDLQIIQGLVYSNHALGIKPNTSPTGVIKTARNDPSSLYELTLNGTAVSVTPKREVCEERWVEPNDTWDRRKYFHCDTISNELTTPLYDFSQTVKVTLDYTLAKDVKVLDMQIRVSSDGKDIRLSIDDTNNDYVMITKSVKTTVTDSFKPRTSPIPFKQLMSEVRVNVVSINTATSLVNSLKVVRKQTEGVFFGIAGESEILNKFFEAYQLPQMLGNCRLRGLWARNEFVTFQDNSTLLKNGGQTELFVKTSDLKKRVAKYVKENVISGNGAKPYRECRESSIDYQKLLIFMPIEGAITPKGVIDFNLSHSF